ncbi:hypothetical protein S40285_10941 [Stachybotrys chlorohalonatus IBT 40285]|uniref:Uncharacterized protein n=1 Tax=Stachybotrys chlorohalonatus (strain IBT 40285) TaxID=1283841 RepID=A0A084Q896_STAC4|nr:hypothetical protein S40285_10941 [Stachybotrys chlorohalonata IBT 40285]
MVSLLFAIGLAMAYTNKVLASPQWTPECIELDFNAFLATPKIDIPVVGPDGLYARPDESACVFTDLGPQGSFATLYPDHYRDYISQVLQLDNAQNFEFLHVSAKRQVSIFARQATCGQPCGGFSGQRCIDCRCRYTTTVCTPPPVQQCTAFFGCLE